MEKLIVERKSIYEDARVTEAEGTVRIIPPLFFAQMLWKDIDGNYRYDKRVPENFWEMYEILIENGWYQYYHFDYWVSWDTKNKEMCGFSTTEAYNRTIGVKNVRQKSKR